VLQLTQENYDNLASLRAALIRLELSSKEVTPSDLIQHIEASGNMLGMILVSITESNANNKPDRGPVLPALELNYVEWGVAETNGK